MAGFLGSLEYVLEEGPRNDWFDDDVDLHFRHRLRGVRGGVLLAGADGARADRRSARASPTAISRSAASFQFCVGIGLYGLTYLYPIYLAQVRGYNALMIGETMFVTGVAHVPVCAARSAG